MKARKSLMLCALAGLAGSASANAEGSGTTSGAPSRPIVERLVPHSFDGPTNHVYINARTGERMLTRLRGSSCSPPIWTNTDIANNGGFFYSLDDPTSTFPASGNQRIGGEALDWGDIEFDSVIDGYEVAYVTTVGTGIAVPGFTLINWWYDNDNGFNDPLSIPVMGIGLASIPGLGTWVLTIDLCGTGLEFELGDTNGSFTGFSGWSRTGGDQDDTDGCPLNDFAYSYVFDQSNTNLPLGVAGPSLVLPASADVFEDDSFVTGAAGNANGVADWFDLYEGGPKATGGVYDGTYDLGGWVPGGANPYASFYMELCGILGAPPCGCVMADFNGDTIVNINDMYDFFDQYANCENMPTPCGWLGNPDINGDTVVDIQDQLDFFDIYSRC